VARVIQSANVTNRGDPIAMLTDHILLHSYHIPLQFKFQPHFITLLLPQIHKPNFHTDSHTILQ
ncbi:hypothetical protein, partial [Paenibacillus sp. Y412MC10]|uniref:hypothetical protein n=1 Tax=Geobacillus sp. (strain Y412MC10) TaxID=481743 RepID=UPI0021B1B1EF